MTDILVKQAEIPTPSVGRPSIILLSLIHIVGLSGDALHDVQKAASAAYEAAAHCTPARVAAPGPH